VDGATGVAVIDPPVLRLEAREATKKPCGKLSGDPCALVPGLRSDALAEERWLVTAPCTHNRGEHGREA
jgi:hypothetical protein